MKFRAYVSKEWTESGSVEFEADDEDEARERAKELLSVNDDAIEWESSNMDPGAQVVGAVVKIEE